MTSPVPARNCAIIRSSTIRKPWINCFRAWNLPGIRAGQRQQVIDQHRQPLCLSGDLAEVALRNLELWRARPDLMRGIKLPVPAESGLLTGEAGILLVAWRLAPSDEHADELLARVRANVDNEAEELMWGSPGTLIAARAMLEWTGAERWREAWNESAEALWSLPPINPVKLP